MEAITQPVLRALYHPKIDSETLNAPNLAFSLREKPFIYPTSEPVGLWVGPHLFQDLLRNVCLQEVTSEEKADKEHPPNT